MQNALASITPICQNVEPDTITINNMLLLKSKVLVVQIVQLYLRLIARLSQHILGIIT